MEDIRTLFLLSCEFRLCSKTNCIDISNYCSQSTGSRAFFFQKVKVTTCIQKLYVTKFWNWLNSLIIWRCFATVNPKFVYCYLISERLLRLFNVLNGV